MSKEEIRKSLQIVEKLMNARGLVFDFSTDPTYAIEGLYIYQIPFWVIISFLLVSRISMGIFIQKKVIQVFEAIAVNTLIGFLLSIGFLVLQVASMMFYTVFELYVMKSKMEDKSNLPLFFLTFPPALLLAFLFSAFKGYVPNALSVFGFGFPLLKIGGLSLTWIPEVVMLGLVMAIPCIIVLFFSRFRVLTFLFPFFVSFYNSMRRLDPKAIVLPFTTILIVLFSKNAWLFVVYFSGFRLLIFAVLIYFVPYAGLLIARRSLISTWLIGLEQRINDTKIEKLFDSTVSLLKGQTRQELSRKMGALIEKSGAMKFGLVTKRGIHEVSKRLFYISLILFPVTVFALMLLGIFALTQMFPDVLISNFTDGFSQSSSTIVRLNLSILLASVGSAALLPSYASRIDFRKWLKDSWESNTKTDFSVEALYEFLYSMR